MSAHINRDGLFQSDKYPTTPAGKVPLSVNDLTAQDLLWEYARRHRTVDAEFSDDLEMCLRTAGFKIENSLIESGIDLPRYQKLEKLLFAAHRWEQTGDHETEKLLRNAIEGLRTR